MSAPVVFGLQMDLAWEYGAVNRARAEVLLEECQPVSGAMVALPEMFTSGFTMNVATVESSDGPTESWLKAIARRWNITLIAGVARRQAGGTCSNEALVIGPDARCLAVYRKQRPFSPSGEHLHYSAGKSSCVFPWNDLKVAVFICYDLRFPELFRTAALERPELYVVIANWPEKRIQHWIQLLQARAIENQAYILGVNRVGSDPTHQYPGCSLLADPSGEIVARAPEGEGCVRGELDLPALRHYREKLPFLNDLR